MTFRPTFDYRAYFVTAVEVSPAADPEVCHIIVDARQCNGEGRCELLFGTDSGKPCPAFNAFLLACGIRNRIDDAEDLVGLVFAMQGDGRNAKDFATYGRARRWLEADQARYVAAQRYAAECAVEGASL